MASRSRSVTLACGAVLLVDEEDAPLVAAHRWRLNHKGYACRDRSRREPPRGVIFLHRLLLGLERDDPRRVDHVNRDKLDCRRANLRVVTHGQNNQNVDARSHGRAGLRGVTWHAPSKRWRANVGRRSFGYYATPEEAAAVAREKRSELLPYSTD